jgi:hypothetical protein
LAVTTTKVFSFAAVLASPRGQEVIAQGVSYAQWWRWEAVSAWRLFRLWGLPVGLSFDHDTFHVSLPIQWFALVALPICLAVLAWVQPSSRWAVCWIVCVLVPRFVIRVPLSPLNEHHWYPVTAGLSVLTVNMLRRT